MHAIAVTQYGADPSVVTMPEPRAGRGEVLTRVHAAGANPMDRMIAAGAWQGRMTGTFPLVLGSDFEGVVVGVGDTESEFRPGDEVFGQLLISPLGSAGTYAEYVAFPEGASVAKVPEGLDPVIAAALPTAGATAFELVESLQPLTGRTVLIAGAAGGVGSFATQFAAIAGAHVIASTRASAADRMREYGAAETLDYTTVSVPDTVRAAHPDGIDVLIDVANDGDGFAELATLVRHGGTALTTRYVADTEALARAGVGGVNFRVRVSRYVLERIADAVVAGRIVPPPITRVALDDVPSVMNGKRTDHADGKTVITLPHRPDQLVLGERSTNDTNC